jgi:hypothetical protein
VEFEAEVAFVAFEELIADEFREAFGFHKVSLGYP